MKTHMIVSVGIASALMMAGCQTAPVDPVVQEQALAADGWQRLDHSQMTAVLPNTTHTGTDPEHGPWTVYLAPDGSMRGKSGKFKDVGTYTLAEDGTYCRQWSTWVKGREGCARYFQKGNQITSLKISGEYDPRDPWNFEPGNTQSL